jgi:hypothetical protein
LFQPFNTDGSYEDVDTFLPNVGVAADGESSFS